MHFLDLVIDVLSDEQDWKDSFRTISRNYVFITLRTHSINIRKMEVRDSNDNVLMDGDTVTLIKDLKVKGSSLTLTRGTVIKKIRLTEDELPC